MKKNEIIMAVALVVMFLLLLVAGYQIIKQSNAYARLQEQSLAMADSGQRFTQTINDLEQRIAEQGQLIVTSQDMLKEQSKELKDLKNIASQVRIETRVEYRDTMVVPFRQVDTIMAADTIDGYVPVPQEFAKTDSQWYAIKGMLTKRGITLTDLSFDNKLQIVIGDKKLGLFKRPEPIVRVTSESPYSTITNLNNAVVIEPTPFYKLNGFWLGVGAVAGGIIVGSIK